MALTVREFDITSRYEELALLEQDGSMYAKEGNWKKGPQECFGDDAYQILLAAGKPRDGMPARVTKRSMQ